MYNNLQSIKTLEEIVMRIRGISSTYAVLPSNADPSMSMSTPSKWQLFLYSCVEHYTTSVNRTFHPNFSSVESMLHRCHSYSNIPLKCLSCNRHSRKLPLLWGTFYRNATPTANINMYGTCTHHLYRKLNRNELPVQLYIYDKIYNFIVAAEPRGPIHPACFKTNTFLNDLITSA